MSGVENETLADSWCLAFETSGAWGSVAIGQGAEIRATSTIAAPRRYAAEFLPIVAELCRGHDVTPQAIHHVFISAGPGSFTGLRIGVTAARMLALAHGAKLVAVSTLEVIAQNALPATPPVEQVAVVLDAKRSHVYAAWFRRQGHSMQPAGDPTEAEPFEFLSRLPADCAVMGEGVAYHRAAVERSGRLMLPESMWSPRAETVYHLGYQRAMRHEFVERRDLIPIYIRPPEAEEKLAARSNPSTSPSVRTPSAGAGP